MEEKIKLGISSCLLGEKVRFDGGHKLDHFLTVTLGKYVNYIPVCPEVESGLGVPREAMRLEGSVDTPSLITVKTGVDHTSRMHKWSGRKVAELEKEELCGFIFKSDSPSSGMEQVKVYDDKGMAFKKGIGIFAGVFMESFPLLPVTDDRRLHDPRQRENFIESVFTLKRWRKSLKKGMSIGLLVDFHTRHKLLVLSHSPVHYRKMGKLLAQAKGCGPADLYLQYQKFLLEALKLKTTTKKHTNVLHHMLGYFKKELSPDEKREVLESIEKYRLEFLPLIVPVTLINHYVRKHNQPYLSLQHYLNPHPLELQLRNHV